MVVAGGAHAKKRDDPFTPDPKRGIHAKKMKEYVSPAPRTPLRNVVTPEFGSRLAKVTTTRGGDENPPAFLMMSASRSRMASTSLESLNDDDEEKRLKRQDVARTKREQKNKLLSPALGSSPKANYPRTTLKVNGTPKSQLGTPVANVIASDLASRPLPGSSANRPKLTAEQRSRMFEDWMKIAADNKINAKNTWNLALIDYFSELTFLKDGNAINFQKASCTLDGCVKIYASRVDSVVDETGRLLNGLSEGNMKQSKYLMNEIGSTEIVDNEGEEGKHAEDTKKATKKTIRHATTLEKSDEALNLKQFDLEFAIDPLFKKTCAEFDESSNRGMLLFSLALSNSAQVIFDSSDYSAEQASVEQRLAEKISIAGLKQAFGMAFPSIQDKSICPTFGSYNIASTNKDFALGDDQLAKTMEKLSRINIQAVELPTQVFANASINADVAPMEGYQNHYDYDMDGPVNDDYDYGDSDNGPDDFEAADGEKGDAGVEYEEQTAGFGFAPNSGPNQMFEYFDDRMKQAWAGPGHWKIRRPRMMPTDKSTSSSSSAKQKKPKGVLEFNIDDDTEIDLEALFVKPASAATITLSKAMIEERSLKNNLLPDDLHFSSVNFLRLFTKPDWKFGSTLSSRRNLRPSANVTTDRTVTFDDVIEGEAAATTQGETGELESNFWAAQASHPEGLANDNTADHNDDAVSFGGDDGGYDYDYDYDGPTYDCGNTQSSQMPATQMSSFGIDLVQLKNSVSAPRLTFARVAKRVDVQRLKQAIWEEIEEDSPSNKKKTPSAVSAGTTFSHLVSGLEASSYPKENLKDVSVSYCFICLLHLANEHGLSINAKDNDLIVVANK